MRIFIKKIFFLLFIYFLLSWQALAFSQNQTIDLTLKKKPWAFLGFINRKKNPSYDIKAFSELKRLWLQKKWLHCLKKSKKFENKKTDFKSDYAFVHIYCLEKTDSLHNIQKYLPKIKLKELSFSRRSENIYTSLVLKWSRWAKKKKERNKKFLIFYFENKKKFPLNLIEQLEGNLKSSPDLVLKNDQIKEELKKIESRVYHISKTTHINRLIKILKKPLQKDIQKSLSLKLFSLLYYKKGVNLKNHVYRFKNINSNVLDRLVANFFWKESYKDLSQICSFARKQMKIQNFSPKSQLYCAKTWTYLANYKQADEDFKSLLNIIPKDENKKYIKSANYYYFLLNIRQKKYDQALNISEKLMKDEKLLENYGSSIYYWSYRSASYLKKQKIAVNYQDKLNKNFPLTYYNLKLNKEKKLKTPFSNFSKKKPEIPKTFKYHYDHWKRLQVFWKSGMWRLAIYDLEQWPMPISAEESLMYSYFFSLSFDHVRSFQFLRKAWEEDLFKNQYWLKMYYPIYFNSHVLKYSKKFNVDPHITLGIIRQESAFAFSAESSAGALGLMQLMPFVGKEMAQYRKLFYSKEKLTIPKYNIHLGVYYFRRLLNALNNKAYALASYNAGIGRFRKWESLRSKEIASNDLWMDEMPWSETAFYVKSVLRNEIIYKQLYNLK